MFLGRGRHFSFLQIIHTGPEVHPASNSMNSGGSLFGGESGQSMKLTSLLL
jgi:hypothetical protein